MISGGWCQKGWSQLFVSHSWLVEIMLSYIYKKKKAMPYFAGNE